MRKLTKKSTYSVIAAATLLSGCGSIVDSIKEAILKGIADAAQEVRVEAICEDGKVYTTYSDQDGNFELKVPESTACSLVVATNVNTPEDLVVAPVAIDEQGETAFEATGSVDLGTIDLQGVVDSDDDRVADTPTIVNPSGNLHPVKDSVRFDSDDDDIPDLYDKDKTDHDNDGTPDILDDDDHNGKPDAYEDKDGDGKKEIDDDDDHDGEKDYYEDDDKNGKPDMLEHDDKNEQDNEMDRDHN